MKNMRYAVITGATKGIGKAIAEKFLREGFFVIANYANDEQSAGRFSKEMSQFTASFRLIKQELGSYESVRAFSESILSITDRVDCLVLNAATTDRSAFEEISPERWQHVMDVNLNAPFFLVQAFAPYICKQTGSVIFMGSMMGQYPHAASLGYSVTKAAVHQLAKSLVKNLSPDGVTVNAIAPGFVETPWQANKPDEIRKSIESKIALHRFAAPEEVADLCWHVFNNRYINGSVVEISGGYCYK